ncbi:MAG: response regulator transcription factor [Clostridiales bacterium]|nr:response regulator transcription factor [Clostridiales bacterium]
MYNILVCDDDKEIVGAIEIYLKAEGYQVFKAYDGAQALDVLEREEIHLVLLDIMMPVLDGIHTTMKIREKHNIPIILISAKSEDGDKILGLNIGADDYITKPFNHLELIARVKSALRRYTNLGSMEVKKSSVITCGGLSLDYETKQVTVDGAEVNLTPSEFNILHLLLENQGRVFSTTQIYERVWNEDAFGSENTVAVHIRHLREKLEIDPKNPRYIKVVWGLGYKIDKEPRA